ncbi:hypothetical protein KLMA_20384 [Kluyveromyces marxianus]|nr:hypothetical protein KLMA_20384 [Kluyveromyces marxianus]
MNEPFSALIIGGTENDSCVRVCRELIFKYGINVTIVGVFDTRDEILYGLEEYYKSSDIRVKSWFSTFDSHIDLINSRRNNYRFISIYTQNWAKYLVGVNVVINLTQYYEPTFGSLLTTPVTEVQEGIERWCHVVELLNQVRFQTKCCIATLVQKDMEFERGHRVLVNSMLQYLDGSCCNSPQNFNVFFTEAQLFQQFENGTYIDIMR